MVPKPGPRTGSGPPINWYWAAKYKMYTGGDTTHFLRMWLIDSSHWSNGAWMEWERWSIKWEWWRWSGAVEEYSRAAVTLSSVDRTAITKGFGSTAVVDNATSINNDPWVSEGFFPPSGNSGFSRSSQKDFSLEGQKWWNFILPTQN